MEDVILTNMAASIAKDQGNYIKARPFIVRYLLNNYLSQWNKV